MTTKALKMKRNIKTGSGGAFKSPPYAKSQEREFGRMAEKMVEVISTRFKNQVIKDLDKKTIDKFADAQAGNYARIFLAMSKRLTKKMIRQYSDKKIEHFVDNLLQKTNRSNRQHIYDAVEKRIGISSVELAATEGLSATVTALELETSQWVKKLRDDTLSEYTANTLRVMAQGGSLTDVMASFAGMTEKRKNHAKFTARNQIANFNSLMTKARAQNLGITEALWITSRDERVRPCHKVRDKKKFTLSEGLYSSCDGRSLLPGVDYQCRCTYELIIPDDED